MAAAHKRSEFLKNEQEQLLRDLQAKHPLNDPKFLNQIISSVAAQLEMHLQHISPTRLAHLLRTMVFEKTTNFPFPPSITADRKEIAQAIMDTIYAAKPGTFKDVPKDVLRGLIEESEIEAWEERAGLCPMSEGQEFFDRVLKKLRDWVLQNEAWGGEVEINEVESVEEVEESRPVYQPLTRHSKLTLKTRFYKSSLNRMR